MAYWRNKKRTTLTNRLEMEQYDPFWAKYLPSLVENINDPGDIPGGDGVPDKPAIPSGEPSLECENCGQELPTRNGRIFPPHPQPCRRPPVDGRPFLICGLDEVGRGALAGPLIAVAAMFNSEKGADWRRATSPIPDINDSKTFSTHAKRTEIFRRILRSAHLVDFGIGEVSVQEINAKGIEEANRIAFYRAWKDLNREPHWILVDGDNPCPAWNYSMQDNRPKGDSFWWPVGAASILAKVIRDNFMSELSLDYPMYKWGQNAGYGTKDHTDALKASGPCVHHRTQFVQGILGGKDERQATRQR